MPTRTLKSGARPMSATRPTLEIAIPVHNEARSLEPAVRRLHRYLSEQFPFSWRLVIVDNASTDGTLAVARRLGS
jgi:glycosyltransferase involved in cell wall biosynthesis